MIELDRFPLLKIMATDAGIILCCIKLPVMRIGMAVQTAAGKLGELLLHCSVRCRLKMALLAGQRSMLSCELEISGVMIKFHFAPQGG